MVNSSWINYGQVLTAPYTILPAIASDKYPLPPIDYHRERKKQQRFWYPALLWVRSLDNFWHRADSCVVDAHRSRCFSSHVDPRRFRHLFQASPAAPPRYVSVSCTGRHYGSRVEISARENETPSRSDAQEARSCPATAQALEPLPAGHWFAADCRRLLCQRDAAILACPLYTSRSHIFWPKAIGHRSLGQAERRPRTSHAKAIFGRRPYSSVYG